MEATHKAQDFVVGSIVGSIVGALTVMLFTTKKGKQLREEIANKYHAFEDRVKGLAEDAEEAIEDGAKKVANKVKKET